MRLFFIILLVSVGMESEAWSQAAFSEGTLIYRIDTVRRLEPQPAGYIARQFTLYKKGDLLRVETLYVNRFDSTDWQRMIQIRNRKGIYAVMEEKPSTLLDSLAKKLAMSRDSLLKAFPAFSEAALLTSYQEEKLSRSTAALQGRLKTYTARQVGQQSSLLSMPTRKVVVTSPGKRDSIEVQVTQAIHIPLGLFFDSLQQINGTALQFTEVMYGWLNRYTIKSVKAQPLTDELFQIDPKMRILTSEQMIQEANDLMK